MIYAAMPIGSHNCAVCNREIYIDTPCYYEYPNSYKCPTEQICCRECTVVYDINPLVYEGINVIEMEVIDRDDPIYYYLMEQVKKHGYVAKRRDDYAEDGNQIW